MIVREFSLHPNVMRKEDPNWKFALGASPITEGVILRLVSEDGVEGFGYASATPHMGSINATLQAELKYLEPEVVGKDAANTDAILAGLNRRLRNAPQAKAAIDCALHDLLARSLGIPLCNLFGGRTRDTVPLLRILAIKTPDEMAAQAQKLVDQGYNYLKIKVHGEVDEDVARVRAIRKQVGDSVNLTIDANQSYNAKSAIVALNRMAEYKIDLAEQPVPAGDMEGLALVTKSVPIVIEADEAAGSLDEVWRLVTTRSVDAVSLKIPKLGGLRNTVAAARICEQGGVAYRFGAAVGSRLLAAHGLHLACALGGVNYACELAEFARLLDDEFSGLEVENGRLALPKESGSGVVWSRNEAANAA
ncbi:MAG: mandelate racemase/muconate lactonizing enzyme family protein [Beijerinckiaceae bacterium]